MCLGNNEVFVIIVLMDAELSRQQYNYNFMLEANCCHLPFNLRLLIYGGITGE